MTQDYAPPRQEDQFREFVGVLKRRKGSVAVGLALCLVLGVISLLLATPSYQVVTRVLLTSYSDNNYRPATDAVEKTSQVGVAPEIGAQIGLLQSPQVIQAAFSQANVSLPAGDALTERILTVKQENTTPVVDIEVNLPDGDAASRLAQAIPAAYNESKRDTDAAKAKAAIDVQRNRLNGARTDLTKAQDALERFSAEGQGKEVVAANGIEGTQRTERLTSLEQQLAAARVGFVSAQSGLESALASQIKIPATIPDTNVRPSVEQIQTQKKLIADLSAELNSLLVTNTENSPEVRSLRAKLKEQTAYLNQIPKTTVLTGDIRNPERALYDGRVAEARQLLASKQSEVSRLEALVADERAGLNAYQKRMPQQKALESAVAEKQTLLSQAAASFGEVQTIGSTPQQAVQVVGTSSPLKTQPAIARTLVASTLLGLVFGVILALLRDRFDNRIQTMEQIYDASGATPIGAVPVGGKALSLQAGAGRNRILESYRSLRYNLEAGETDAVQSVLVTSASAGEGRASLSMNLATEAATDMRKTILVDADMRTPELHERLRASRGPGLSDVLSGAVTLAEVLKETGTPNLIFLSAGAEHANPLELLSGPSMAATHEALKEMADVIVFNSPSLMRYTDARALAKVTDSAIFVAKRGFTRRDAMRYCVGMLRRAKASFLGVVLVDEKGGGTTDVPYFATE